MGGARVKIYAWYHNEAGHLDAYGRAGRGRMHCNVAVSVVATRTRTDALPQVSDWFAPGLGCFRYNGG